jgi:hemoglobin
MNDIADRADIEALVDAFYTSAFADPLIGHIFTDVAKMDLAHHLPIMCDFWQTVLFAAGLYRRNALQVHFVLNAREPLTPAHFDRWLELWTQSVDHWYAGPVAERAKLQAQRIAGSMQRRIAGRSGSEFESIAVAGRAGEAEWE